MLQSMMRWKILHVLLAVLLTVEGVPIASAGDEDLPQVKNVRVQVAGPMVYLYYDLLGSPQKVYRVTITLKSRTDSTFSYTPLSTYGDIGDDVFAGTDWRVAWNYSKELEGSWKEDDYYFVLEATVRVSDREVERWYQNPYYIAGGAAAVGLLALLIFGGKKTTSPPASTDFPAPPGRP